MAQSVPENQIENSSQTTRVTQVSQRSNAIGGSSADPKVIHVLNRLGFGPRPGDIRQVQSQGLQTYIQSQLNPDSIPMPRWLSQNLQQFKTLNQSAATLFQTTHPRQVRLRMLRKEQRGLMPSGKGNVTKEQRKARNQALFKALQKRRTQETRAEKRAIQKLVARPVYEATQARLLRAVNSPRQLEEVLVNFWFNHFNVSARKGHTRMWTGTYEEQAIRPHVLGSFRKLLGATARHPAMLFYLDNWRSKANALNENYARELLELHTLGVEGGYSQKDIIEVARVFTGWRFAPLQGNARKQRPANTSARDFFFDRKAHDFGSKTVLGKNIAGTGQEEGEQVLDLLAQHPSTAQHISFKLAQYFVADTPPSSLVSDLAKQFMQSKGNIKTVLSALFSSQEFWQAQYYGRKFKTPYEYLISSFRATGQTKIDSQKIVGMLRQLDMPLYGCETPDGYKNVQSAWLSPDAMMRRLSFATAIARGQGGASQPTNSNQLAQTLGYAFSPQTSNVLKSSPEQLQVATILGSPEMMLR